MVSFLALSGLHFQSDLKANLAGARFPKAECGRWWLLSSFHDRMVLRAPMSVENSVSFRYSSRKRPLKLSTKVFCVGLPGVM